MPLNFKKYAYKYEYLTLELEETKEKFESFQKQWTTLFTKYFPQDSKLAYQNEETGEIRYTIDEEAATGKKPKPAKLKKLYYKLSGKTHPDKGGNDQLFDRVNKAYKQSNYIELLKLAEASEINTSIDEEDIYLFEDSCSNISTEVDKIKQSLTWQYFTGDRVTKRIIINKLVTEFSIEIPEKDIEILLET